MLTPLNAVGRALRGYVNFSGRARRSEFWWFVAFYALLAFVATVLDVTFGWHTVPAPNCAPNMFCPMQQGVQEPGYLFDLVVEVALFLPLLAVTMRRLHDTHHRGTWAWLYFGPYTISAVYGYIYLLSGVASNGWISLVLDLLALLGGLALLPFLIEPTLPLKKNSELPVTEAEEAAPGADA